MKVLITGFEPYWDYTENSSWVVAEEVATRGFVGVEIFIEQMPTSFSHVGMALRKVVAKHLPDMIILLGQSGGSDRVQLERVALNMMDSKRPDNDGYIANEAPINFGGPSALFTNTPIKTLCATIEEQGISVKISNSCGLYVCNRLYYEALMLCNERHMRAIFVHLPFYEGQPSANHNNPTIPLDDMVKAIQIIIEVINDNSREI